MKRAPFAIFLALVLAGCGSASPTSSQPPVPTDGQSSNQPTGSGQPQPTSGQPTSSPVPHADEPYPLEPGELEITDEFLNPPPVPLPEPELTSVDEIAEAMFAGGGEEQTIVSMLAALRVGIYNVDGTSIRVGTEQSDADFYLFEPEVRGLIAMLQAQMDGETWITFRDFHADLVEFGLEATPEELLQVYLDTYAEHPDTPMTRFVQAQAFLDLEAQIPPLGVWLLFVDGMVPPHAASAPAALSGPGALAQGQAPNIGQAFGQLQQYFNSPKVQRQINSARARAALAGAAIKLEATSRSAHKGHGGPGDTVKFTATVNSFVGNSGFGGPPTTPCAGGSLGGIPVTWLHPQLDEHGTTTVQSGFGNTMTDATGRTTMTFVADPEEDRAWERGPQVTALGHVGVIIEQADVARALCPGIPTGRGTTVSNLTNPLILRIRYHVPRAILVILTNPFDILFKGGSQVGGDADLEGEDFYVGRLEERPDGIWHGFFLGRTSGGGTGVFWAADRTCASSYAAYQVLEVFGESGPARLPSDPILTSNGNFRLDFYAEAPVVAQVGTRLCSAALRPGGRYPWAPFNSPFVWSGIGLGINLPPDPGGTSQYLEVPENSTVEYKGLTGWIVDIRYLKPPEPPP